MTQINKIEGEDNKTFKQEMHKLSKANNKAYETIPLKDIPDFYSRNIASTQLVEYINEK